KRWWDAWLPGFEGAVSGDQDFDYHRAEQFRDFAAFGALTWHFTDRFHGTLGLRWFDNKFENTTLMDLPAYTGLFTPSTSRFEVEDDDVLFKLNLAWDISDSSMIYGTVSEGYRRGGTNAVPTEGTFAEDPAWQRYASDSVVNYELGLKSSLRKMRLSAAAFFIDWQDVQINTSTPNWGFFSVMNGGEASSRGLE